MPISLQSDAVLPQGHILVDGQRVVSFSTTGGLSANSVRAESIGGTASQFLVPVGAVMAFTTSTAPSGWLKLNGAELIRSDFPALWTFAQSSGNLVSEATWTATNQGSFSTGNTTTTFRLPDLRGEFIRGWAEGRNVGGQSARTFGSFEGDAIRNMTGDFKVSGSSGGIDSVTGVFELVDPPKNRSTGTFGSATSTIGIARFNASNAVPTADDNRPRNVALLYCIKY